MKVTREPYQPPVDPPPPELRVILDLTERERHILHCLFCNLTGEEMLPAARKGGNVPDFADPSVDLDEVLDLKAELACAFCYPSWLWSMAKTGRRTDHSGARLRHD